MGTPLAPIFIVGSDRSGSTLLRLILNSHPLVSVPAETWFLIDLMDEFGTTTVLESTQIDRAIEIITGKRRWRNFDVSIEHLKATISELHDATLGDLFDALMTLEVAHTGKPRWADKTPEYVLHLDRLVTVFPRALWVHITRDGRDVYQSLRKQRWRGRTPFRIANYWAACIDAGFAAAQVLGPNRMLTVRYEDLVLDMEATVRRMCDFLDIPFAGSMLDFHETAAANVPRQSIDRGFHTKLLRPAQNSDAFKWKTQRFEWRGWLFESMVVRQLLVAGYDARMSNPVASLMRMATLAHHLIASATTKLSKSLSKSAGSASSR